MAMARSASGCPRTPGGCHTIWQGEHRVHSTPYCTKRHRVAARCTDCNSVQLCCRITATLSCPMKLHKYPLDTQGCPILFSSCKSPLTLTLTFLVLSHILHVSSSSASLSLCLRKAVRFASAVVYILYVVSSLHFNIDLETFFHVFYSCHVFLRF